MIVQKNNKFSESIKATGNITIEITHKNSDVKQIIKQTNLVVDSGIQVLAISLAAKAGIDFSHISAGTRSTVAAKTDTKLVNEVCRADILAFTSNQTNTAIYGAYFDFSQAPGMVINEVGLIVAGADTLDSGTLFARAVLDTPIEKTAENAFSITWALRFD